MIKRQIDCALGKIPCEWQLKNARLVDVYAGRIVEKADIFIDSGKVVDAGVNYKARALRTVDLEGAFVAPGFIDAHVHIESSMLSPVQFARLIVPFGTTTIIADPPRPCSLPDSLFLSAQQPSSPIPMKLPTS